MFSDFSALLLPNGASKILDSRVIAHPNLTERVIPQDNPFGFDSRLVSYFDDTVKI